MYTFLEIQIEAACALSNLQISGSLVSLRMLPKSGASGVLSPCPILYRHVYILHPNLNNVVSAVSFLMFSYVLQIRGKCFYPSKRAWSVAPSFSLFQLLVLDTR